MTRRAILTVALGLACLEATKPADFSAPSAHDAPTAARRVAGGELTVRYFALRRRTQVVKGADCKSVMRRFESARRLQLREQSPGVRAPWLVRYCRSDVLV